MSQSQYYKSFLLFIVFSVLFAKVLVPNSYSNSSELLSKKNKYREYYEISNSGLEYTIEGPAEVKIFSKAAYPKRTSNEFKDFSLNVSINELEIELNNSEKIDKKTFSSSHPMHVYTYSSKDVLVLPSGTYNIKINKKSRFSCNPILIRVLRSGRKSKNFIKEEINLPIHEQYRDYNLIREEYLIDNNRSTVMPKYYIIDSIRSFFINKSNDLFEINIRGLHDSVYDEYKIIKMVLEKNGKLDTRYHMLSIPHPSKIITNSDYIPSRLNKIYIYNDDNFYELKVKESNESLMIRLNRLISNKVLN